MGNVGEMGYLRVGNEADRVTLASILYKNGYTVRPVRRKKNNKSYEYYVYYQMNSLDEEETYRDG